jgi:hypothetical protein
VTREHGLPTDTLPCREVLSQGHGVACIRLARAPGRTTDRYALVRQADAVVLGELRWSGKLRCSLLVPGAQTACTSGVLS